MGDRIDDRDQWTESRPTEGRRALRLDELWGARELVAFLALRDVKVRYKQAVFGGAWAIAQPLAAAVIFTVVFGRLAKISSGDVPYLVFAFSGFSLWSYFSTAVNDARNSLVGNSALITKVYFPRLAIPLASILPGLVDLAVALVVLAVMCVSTGIHPGLEILTAPLFLFGAMVVAFGAGTLFAALSVRYRDVQQVFGLLLQLWLFATPVAYPSTLVKGGWRWLYAINPMVGAVDGWRWALLGGRAPGREALVSALVALGLLYAGLRVFQQSERRFADVI
ncbi:MAG TPA: ABC transporter permease [Acidimicrobiia bacterium]|nr:ABC transporter permease [Acidimicrobiia bacterium]